MRKTQICIYGGTGLSKPASAFVTELTRTILGGSPAVIVTGGFLHFAKEPEAMSTDHAALEGARQHAESTGVPLCECFEAWLPEPDLDRKREKGGVVRMTKAEHGVTVRRMGQKSPLGRRLSMVHDVDVVVTISGKRHTNEVLEQALELNVPALPVPFAGGDSRDFWELYRDSVMKWFSLSTEEADALERLKEAYVAANLRETARLVAALVARARVGRCLVLLPFGEDDTLFREVIEPAVESVMICDRLDRRPSSAAIRSHFVDAVERARAVIADVSLVRPNVMYEIGYALAKGLQPMFFCNDATIVEQLPVYLRDLNIAVITSKEDLDVRIRSHLAEVRSVARQVGS